MGRSRDGRRPRRTSFPRASIKTVLRILGRRPACAYSAGARHCPAVPAAPHRLPRRSFAPPTRGPAPGCAPRASPPPPRSVGRTWGPPAACCGSSPGRHNRRRRPPGGRSPGPGCLPPPPGRPPGALGRRRRPGRGQGRGPGRGRHAGPPPPPRGGPRLPPTSPPPGPPGPTAPPNRTPPNPPPPARALTGAPQAPPPPANGKKGQPSTGPWRVNGPPGGPGHRQPAPGGPEAPPRPGRPRFPNTPPPEPAKGTPPGPPPRPGRGPEGPLGRLGNEGPDPPAPPPPPAPGGLARLHGRQSPREPEAFLVWRNERPPGNRWDGCMPARREDECDDDGDGCSGKAEHHTSFGDPASGSQVTRALTGMLLASSTMTVSQTPCPSNRRFADVPVAVPEGAEHLGAKRLSVRLGIEAGSPPHTRGRPERTVPLDLGPGPGPTHVVLLERRGRSRCREIDTASA